MFGEAVTQPLTQNHKVCRVFWTNVSNFPDQRYSMSIRTVRLHLKIPQID
jgi:hypothetical protein